MSMTRVVHLGVYAPIASFRASYAREFLESFPVPPMATVYGMLLSLVGEEARFRHIGAEIALAMESDPVSSLILRKVRRVRARDLEDPRNSRPDFQEILTNIRFQVWVSDREESIKPALAERLVEALTKPGQVSRYGALSLGESRDLVDEVVLNPVPSNRLRWLLPEERGSLMLPVWVDHVGSAATRWGRFELREMEGRTTPAREWFVPIGP